MPSALIEIYSSIFMHEDEIIDIINIKIKSDSEFSQTNSPLQIYLDDRPYWAIKKPCYCRVVDARLNCLKLLICFGHFL